MTIQFSCFMHFYMMCFILLCSNVYSLFTVQYFTDSTCSTNSYGVGVATDCVVNGVSSSISFTCDSTGLVQYEYSTGDCSGIYVTSTIIGSTSSCINSFAGNEYFSSASSAKITCDASTNVSYKLSIILSYINNVEFMFSGSQIVPTIPSPEPRKL
jgi:hypothetical protein